MTQTSKKNCVKIEIKADIPPEIATKIFQAIRSSMNPEISFTNKDEVTEISFSGPHLLIKFFSQDIVTLRSIVNSNMRLIYASFRSLTD
ncbi:MAG: KEOPS complex subunit Pcc1 [Nitrososphaeraceae archaeon]|jgi:tRNA threonylcarbamoyladenosine modification (KEOPS) complex  Pcc1 subunit